MPKNAKNRGSFSPSPVPPLINGRQNSPKITEHSAEHFAEWGWGTFGEYLLSPNITYLFRFLLSHHLDKIHLNLRTQCIFLHDELIPNIKVSIGTKY